jgi:ribosomal-protein-alanine N-acetyltransferase
MQKHGYSPRPATADDLDQVVAIEQKYFQPPWSKGAFQAELEKSTSHLWVITDDETDQKVLAYMVFAYPAEQAHIQTFAVKPDERGRGLGKYLLRQVIAFVMRKQGESIVLEVRKGNVEAVHLYQSMGFIVLRTLERFYPNGEDGYSMIYRTERSRIMGDAEADFENDDGKPENLN